MAIMSDWLRTHQPQPVSGVTDSPGNHPAPRMPGQLASGHAVTDSPPGGDPHDPGRVDVHDWNQCISPTPFAVIQTQYGQQGALASSIEANQGRVALGLLELCEAANPTLTSQLAAPPSGNPHLSGGMDRTAPSGHGERFAQSAPRNPGMAYQSSAIGGQRPAGFTMFPARRAPGE